MCRSVDQSFLASSSFASALGEAQGQLVSVGRYALRGVGRPQDLFTLDPQALEAALADGVIVVGDDGAADPKRSPGTSIG